MEVPWLPLGFRMAQNGDTVLTVLKMCCLLSNFPVKEVWHVILAGGKIKSHATPVNPYYELYSNITTDVLSSTGIFMIQSSTQMQ